MLTFDNLHQKKNTALRKDKSGRGHKIAQTEIAPMGPPA